MIIASLHVKFKISVKIKSSGMPVDWVICLLKFWSFIYLFIYFLCTIEIKTCVWSATDHLRGVETSLKVTRLKVNLMATTYRKNLHSTLLGLVRDLGLQVSSKTVESSCGLSRNSEVALLEKERVKFCSISEFPNNETGGSGQNIVGASLTMSLWASRIMGNRIEIKKRWWYSTRKLEYQLGHSLLTSP